MVYIVSLCKGHVNLHCGTLKMLTTAITQYAYNSDHMQKKIETRWILALPSFTRSEQEFDNV